MPKISHDKLSVRLRAIADPHRREILRMLALRGHCSIDKPYGMCATDIENRLKIAQPTISHHLRILVSASLVVKERVGQWIWFHRNEGELKVLLKEMKNL